MVVRVAEVVLGVSDVLEALDEGSREEVADVSDVDVDKVLLSSVDVCNEESEVVLVLDAFLV
jgi:hypothetical protein